MHLKVSVGVHQPAAVNMDKELEMAERISTENVMCDVCHDKLLTEGVAEAKVHGEVTFSKCCAVSCLEGETCM